MSDHIKTEGGNKLGAIMVLCGLLAVGGFIVQWRINGQLRRENARLRPAQQLVADESQEQRMTQPAASSDDSEHLLKERVELLRLRNEVRQLRERVAEGNVLSGGEQKEPIAAPGDNPLVSANPNPTPRVELTAEWRGMEQFATNKYAQARDRLTNANHYIERFMALGDVAKMNFAFGRIEDAQACASELLVLADKYKEEIWSKGACGQAVHDGNIVLGRLALEQGAIEDAKRYLLEAGATEGSPVLGSFGPNMSLARELLEKGERETVLQYFERCGRFWKIETLRQWSDDVGAGKIPNFGGNLLY